MKALLSSLVIALALSVNAYAYQIADARYDGEYNGVKLNEMQTAFNSVSARESGGVDVGMVVVWNRVENPLNWEKWMECNGAPTPEEQAKLLASDMCTQYKICSVPDYRGMFLRGHGEKNYQQNNGSRVGTTWTTHRSGELGQVQGDALRNIYGETNQLMILTDMGVSTSKFRGALEYNPLPCGTGSPEAQTPFYGHYWFDFKINSSNVVPTADEIRPVNMAVRYLIRVNE